MKSLIIGASGLVGGYLYKRFSALEEAVGTAFPEKQRDFLFLDIRDASALRKLFLEYKPQIVLCPAAISNVEFCQEHPDESRSVNIEGLSNVIKESKRSNSRLVFFSSEYVFDGRNGPYLEDELPNPINEYGKEKLEIENLIQRELSNYIIVRTTVIYGWEKEGKNFIMHMLKNLRQAIPMKVPVDQFSSPTYAGDLADAVGELVSAGHKGIFNIVGSQVINRFEFAKIACDVFGLNPGLLIPVKTSQLNQKAARPLNAGLKIGKVSGLIKTALHPPLQGLIMMKEEKDAPIYSS